MAMRMPQYVAAPLPSHLEAIRAQIAMLPTDERRQLQQALNRDTLRRNDRDHRAHAERAERETRLRDRDRKRAATGQLRLEGAA